MQKFVEQKFIGERAMFGAKDAEFERCGFAEGESPLKHGQNLRLKNCTFEWKISAVVYQKRRRGGRIFDADGACGHLVRARREL